MAERVFFDGKTEFKLGVTLSDAYRVFADRLRSFQDQDIVGMSDLADRYSWQVLIHKAPATQRSNRLSLGHIRAYFEPYRVADVLPVHIYRFRDALAASHSKKVANLALEVLSHMFTKAIEWGARADHPMTGKKVAKFPIKPRTRYVTDAELLAFASILPEYWRLYISLKLHLGLSKGDLLSIRLADLSGNRLFVIRNKTGQRTTYTLSDSAMALVAAIIAYGHSDQWLFATAAGVPYIKPDRTTSGFDTMWQRYMRKAVSMGKLKERFTEHDLRSKVASDVSLDHAQQLLQQFNAATTRRNYRVLGEQVHSR